MMFGLTYAVSESLFMMNAAAGKRRCIGDFIGIVYDSALAAALGVTAGNRRPR
ncbi:MAG: hypothetical protein ACU84J_03380 [Gammaproteobacteria bacterium]